MSLFKRSISLEITSHAGIVFSSLIVIWLSVLLVRLLGQAAQGVIGANTVFAIAALSSITALPIILSLALFVGVVMTISRNYREHEMMVWLASGISVTHWIRPTLRIAVPTTLIIATITLWASPWAYQQIGEYRERFRLRSEISKVAVGQFIEAQGGTRILFIEPPSKVNQEMGQVFASVKDSDWQSIIIAQSASISTDKAGNRYVNLGKGTRYDLKPDSNQFRMASFDYYTVRVNQPNSGGQEENIRNSVLSQLKARPSLQLLNDHNRNAESQLLWRISIPIAAFLLSLLAIPLGAVNPRLGKSGALIAAGLVGMIYMNLINLERGLIANGKLNGTFGMITLHGTITLLIIALFWYRNRIRAPKSPQ